MADPTVVEKEGIVVYAMVIAYTSPSFDFDKFAFYMNEITSGSESNEKPGSPKEQTFKTTLFHFRLLVYFDILWMYSSLFLRLS